jgi:hypothetical protein
MPAAPDTTPTDTPYMCTVPLVWATKSCDDGGDDDDDDDDDADAAGT